MDNVPAGTNGPAYTPRNVTGRPHEPVHRSKPKKNKLKLVAAAVGVLLLLVLALGAWFFFRSSTAASIDGSKYQAVFFTNGQVYFGKLETLNSSYMKMTKVFYLQAQTPATGADDSNNPQATADEAASDIKLIKLGEEVHGPEDEMIISKDQILFFENLKPQGKVTDSIIKYLSTKQ